MTRQYHHSVGLPGETHGILTVLREDSPRGGKRYVICACECGNTTSVRVGHLRDTGSCGCRTVRRTHGATGTPEWNSWRKIKERCCDPNCPAYPDYGGRGIKMCKEWLDSFEKFYESIGPRPAPGYTVDRINNNKGYKPGNVRWATQKEQARNSRWNRVLTYDGRRQPLIVWAEELGISDRTLLSRLDRGWSVQRALSTPVTAKKRRRRGSLTFRGRTLSIPAWAKIVKIPFKTISARLNRGWSVEKALLTPKYETLRR